MIYLAWAIVVVSGIAAASWLVVEGHACFGTFVLLVAGCATASSAGTKGDE
jgi:hypothetical protein